MSFGIVLDRALENGLRLGYFALAQLKAIQLVIAVEVFLVPIDHALEERLCLSGLPIHDQRARQSESDDRVRRFNREGAGGIRR